MTTSVQPDSCLPAEMAAVLHDCRFAGGISASGQSHSFGGNLFTRDTLRVVSGVIGLRGYESFAREMLSTLPQWQGVTEDPSTNEFPDALPHQVFRQIVGGRLLPDAQLDNARYWTNRWRVTLQAHAVNGWQFVIYNSSDGPLLYLITLGEYCNAYGRGVLGDRFLHHPTGEYRTVAEAAKRCIDYIVRTLQRNEAASGLYSVPNTNPAQTSPSGVMRDGFDAYVRTDGTAADYSSTAFVENQALAYHALLTAAQVLFPDDPEAYKWLGIARELRHRTLNQLWTKDFFAAALDANGPVDMISSAAFEVLDGPFFDDLKDGPDYIRALVSRLYSPDFMTPIGARMTSSLHDPLEAPYYAYQGSGAVWGITNGIIAKGLLRHRLPVIAHDIGIRRLVGWFRQAAGVYEMTYVDRATGEPLLVQATSGTRPIYAAELGQPGQAWSASAALHLLSVDFRAHGAGHGSWQDRLQRELRERARAFPAAGETPASGESYVDLEGGKRLKQARAARLSAAA